MFKRTNLIAILWIAMVIFSWSQNSYALGVPGFPALNTAFGMISLIFIGIMETFLVYQLIFHVGMMHRGMQGEKEKCLLIAAEILLVPMVPSIVQFIYNEFFTTGAVSGSNAWDGR